MEAKWPHGEECRRHYFDLLNCQLSRLFPGFIRNLQIQSPQEREMGRAAVLEYSKEEYSDHKVFHGSDELQDYFEQTSVHQPQNPQQRLFLLEDLSRNYVEVLGSQLRIPPSFFGAHWNDPTAAAFNHRNPFRQFSENGFLIRYPSDQPVQIAECGEGSNTYSWNANVNRNLYCYDPKGPLTEYPKSYHILSFWTTGVRDDGSWDSVLLVDPPIGGFVKAPTTGKLVKVNHHLQDQSSNQMEDLHPDFGTFHILPQNMSQWSDVWRCPQYDSIFDDALFLNQVSQQRIDNPRASTAIMRKLVISVFLAFLRCRCLNMLRRQAGLQADLSRINRCDYLRDFTGGMLGRWQHDLFGFNVNVKHRMNVLIKEVEENMGALGLDHNGIIPGVTIPTWERDGWRAIHASCTTILNMTEILLQSYLQFISIEEAQLSNKNARSLGRITHLTLIFIPLSTIAAILSMDEDFLPGKRKGWVFWAIAFPVLLLMLVNTKESRQWIRQLWVNRRNLLQRSWKGIF